MATISQLPLADPVSASDLIPISQGGSAHAVSIGALLAQTQPAIISGPASLLGRTSIGPGGPEAVAIGSGLTLSSGTLTANTFDPAGLPFQTNVSASDQLIIINAGAVLSTGLGQLRMLFSAGSNVAIDTNGVISASALSSVTYSLTTLSPVTVLASQDLVGVSQGGRDHSIAYSNLINGLTIDQAQPATSASDTDTFWVNQATDTMRRQTLSVLWPWISGKLPLWRRPVVELNADTVIDGPAHNNTILLCINTLLISAPAGSLGTGFSCELINASSGLVSLARNIVTSSGSNMLVPNQCGTIYCVTWSGGSKVFASVGVHSLATTSPEQVSSLVATSVGSTSILLSWSDPPAGDNVSTFSVEFRVTGSVTWVLGGQNNGSTSYTITDLQIMTSYDIRVTAINNIGPGPASIPITVTTLTGGALPGAPTGIVITGITASSLICSWTAPAGGATQLLYSVQYSITTQNSWIPAAVGLSINTYNVVSLIPATTYDLRVLASNSAGAGPPSVVVTARTAQADGPAVSIAWNLPPSGNYIHGVGAIGVNAHVSPNTTPVQFGFSTSSTMLPTSWTLGVHVNSDLWGTYAPTPPTAGSWYGWVECTDGSIPTIYPVPFAVT